MATPGSAGGGFVFRSKVQTGDPIRTFDDAQGNKVQVVAIADCFGDITGIDTNPFHVQGAVLDAIQIAAETLADAIQGGAIQADVISSVLPTGAATEMKQDDAIAVLNLLLTALQNPVAPSGTTDVNVVGSTLPTGAATEAKQDDIITAIAGLADEGEVQPVDVQSSVLPTGASTEATLAAVLTAIGNLAELTETQPVSITGTLPLPTGGATETTLLSVVSEIQNLADSTETQPVSLASQPLPTGAATEVTLAALLTELQAKADTGEAQNVSVSSSVLPTGAATSADLTAILTELQAKADLTETQPVSMASVPLPTGAATEVTLAAMFAELAAKADLTETQPVSVVNFPADRATETTLLALLTELAAKADLTETQPVSLASIPLPPGVALDATLVSILTELQAKADLTETQPVSVAGTVDIDDVDIVQKLCDLFDELQLKPNKTDIQPVKVCTSVLPDGAAEEATLSQLLAEAQLPRTLVQRFDETDPLCVYWGEALSGSLTGDPVWSIRKITVSGPFTDIERANGGAFDQVWDDRAILVYAQGVAMAVNKDLATLVGHLAPFSHLAEAIVFDTDSTGATTSVKEAILDLQAGIGATGFPAVAQTDCDLSLVIGQFVYVDALGILRPALADDIATGKVIGVVSGTDSSFGTPCDIKATGSVTAYVGLTPGERYFLSETAPGGIQTTVPTTSGHVIKFVGTALSTDTLFIDTSQPLTIRG